MTRPLTYGDRVFEFHQELAKLVHLPRDRARRLELAADVVCSRGVPCQLTPYGAIRAVIAFANGATDDAFYRDGERLLKASLARIRHPERYAELEREMLPAPVGFA